MLYIVIIKADGGNCYAVFESYLMAIPSLLSMLQFYYLASNFFFKSDKLPNDKTGALFDFQKYSTDIFPKQAY